MKRRLAKCRSALRWLVPVVCLQAAPGQAAPAVATAEQNRARGNFSAHIARPARYVPSGTDFVVTNGTGFFNRPLYAMHSAFRVDGGDQPEFSLYLPGRGGNVRLGLQTAAGTRWLNGAQEVVMRYRPGSLLYAIRDPLLGSRQLNLTVLPLAGARGFIVRVELRGAAADLLWAYGGANGMRGARGGDIGCEREPVSEFFQLHPDQCRDDRFSIQANTFTLSHQQPVIQGVMPGESRLRLADAADWASPEALLAPTNSPARPLLVGRVALPGDRPVYLLWRVAPRESAAGDPQEHDAAELPQVFAAAERYRRTIAERVVVETPDPFINAATAALNVAADAVWDDAQQAFMHGAVAWRTRLLGWRGPYAGDELGWHERTAAHLAGFARQQNTNPVPERLPAADAEANLARNETGLHSNGDLTRSHYDMNLVAIDAFFRHLLWTGDLDYARRMWPVLERHLAWERRLFRREFGADKLPLYEAYAAIWASDNLQYNGGGVTHASAYNCWHNRMAARVATLLGKEAAPYEQEAELVARAMRTNLWLPDEGWFGEFKDYLGQQRVHPAAGLWTFYHTLDSDVPTPFEAWEMTRFVDTQIAHIPIRGPGVPEEPLFTLPETSWMPYTWSLNNVVMAEVAHTALGYWQAGRGEAAFPLFKGCLMDSMFLGLCPGNVGAMTGFDVARGEAQRDFADGCGATARALIEGLFGVRPDALAGELTLRPGFPAQWEEARLKHPDLSFTFRRQGLEETYAVEPRFSRPLAVRWQVPALRDSIAQVTMNGQPTKWRMVQDCVGWPRVEIEGGATDQTLVIHWQGRVPAGPTAPATVACNGEWEAKVDGQELLALSDPQKALSQMAVVRSRCSARATGTTGHRTVFASVRQGELTWWQPLPFEIGPKLEAAAAGTVDWKHKPGTPPRFELVDLAPFFNDRVTQIFRNEYRSPRSPFVSLALPKQGIGGWCDIQTEFAVDDAGLRAAAAQNAGIIRLPNGVPLRTPAAPEAKNVLFTSQWDNYPREVSLPLAGKSAHAFLLMAGSSNPMQSRFDNGEVVVAYADGTSARLGLRNPANWWPIEQDYFIDEFAFRREEPIPPRVDLRTGNIRIPDLQEFKGRGGKIPGGAATVLDLPLDPTRELRSLTVRAVANEVVIGLMSLTLQR